MKRSYPLLLLLLVSLYGCNNSSADGTQDNPKVTIYIGQIYPTQHVILQPILNDTARFAWSESIDIYPLISNNKNSIKTFQAKLKDKISNTYVPMLENMLDAASSKCTQAGYQGNNSYQYLLKNEVPIQDYFSRGMPDNCTTEDNAARYESAANVMASYPVLATSSDYNLIVDYKNAGKLRPLSTVEQEQVARYIKDFNVAYRQAYGEKKDNIGKIPTLASAQILLQARLGKTDYNIRVSTWERITVAYHIYRIIEVSLLRNGKIINSNEISRYQGVLG